MPVIATDNDRQQSCYICHSLPLNFLCETLHDVKSADTNVYLCGVCAVDVHESSDLSLECKKCRVRYHSLRVCTSVHRQCYLTASQQRHMALWQVFSL